MSHRGRKPNKENHTVANEPSWIRELLRSPVVAALFSIMATACVIGFFLEITNVINVFPSFPPLTLEPTAISTSVPPSATSTKTATHDPVPTIITLIPPTSTYTVTPSPTLTAQTLQTNLPTAAFTDTPTSTRTEPPTSFTFLPTSTNTPRPTVLVIKGDADPVDEYATFDCSPPGIYIVKYESGSYYVNSEYGWRTVILIQVDHPFTWSNEYIHDPQPSFDYFVGRFGIGDGVNKGYETSQDAEVAPQTHTSVSINCEDYMIFVPMDIQGYYADQNRGSVSISIVRD